MAIKIYRLDRKKWPRAFFTTIIGTFRVQSESGEELVFNLSELENLNKIFESADFKMQMEENIIAKEEFIIQDYRNHRITLQPNQLDALVDVVRSVLTEFS